MACGVCLAENIEILENVIPLKWANFMLENIIVNYSVPFKVCLDCYKRLEEIHKFCEFVEQRQVKNSEETMDESESVFNYMKLELLSGNEESNNEEPSCNDDQTNEIKVTNIRKFLKNVDANTFITNDAEGNPMCLECKKIFKSVHALTSHITKKHSNKAHTCKICSQEFPFKRGLQKHVMEMHRKMPTNAVIRPASRTCKICQKTYNCERTLQDHMARIHKERYTCETCNIGFLRKKNLELHIARGHNEDANEDNDDLNDRTCIICKSLYKNLDALRYHMKQIHPNETPYPCKDCGLKFKNNYACRKHYTEVHMQKDPKGYSPEDRHCILCDIGFKKLGTLRNHMETYHKGERPFACDKCGAKYSLRISYQRHINEFCSKRKKKFPIDNEINNQENNCSSIPPAIQPQMFNYSFRDNENPLARLSNDISFNEQVTVKNGNFESSLADQIFVRSIKTEKQSEFDCGETTKLNTDSLKNEKAEHETSICFDPLKEHEDSTIQASDENSFVDQPLANVKSLLNGIEDEDKISDDQTKYDGSQATFDVKSFITHDANGNPMCGYCNKIYKTVHALTCHIAIKHDTRKHFCKFCNQEFPFKRALQKHIVEKHKKPVVTSKIRRDGGTCVICQITFKSNKALQIHLGRIHKERYFCDTCGIAFPKKINLEQHIAQGHNEDANDANEDIKDRTCIICNKLYKNLDTLRCHMNHIHPNINPYPCKACGLKFKNNYMLRKHYTHAHTNPDRKGYNPEDRHCALCDIGFVTLRALRCHMETYHKGVRPYACDSCSAKFSLRISYRRHVNKTCSYLKKRTALYQKLITPSMETTPPCQNLEKVNEINFGEVKTEIVSDEEISTASEDYEKQNETILGLATNHIFNNAIKTESNMLDCNDFTHFSSRLDEK